MLIVVGEEDEFRLSVEVHKDLILLADILLVHPNVLQ